jgi:hypothetical protein
MTVAAYREFAPARQKARILVVMQRKALVLPYRLWASCANERNNHTP